MSDNISPNFWQIATAPSARNDDNKYFVGRRAGIEECIVEIKKELSRKRGDSINGTELIVAQIKHRLVAALEKLRRASK